MKILWLITMFAVSTYGQDIDYNLQVRNSPGLMSDVARSPFPTFYAACSAAASANDLLAVTKVWNVTTSARCASPLAFHGGKVRPGSGQTVTFTVQSAPLSALCDISAGGNCIITSSNGTVYPEYWGAVAGSDSTMAWQAALNTVSASNNSLRITVPNNNGACYKISTTLTHIGNNLASLTLEGTLLNGMATGGSCLLWTGSRGGALTHFFNETTAVIRNMEFKGNGLALTDLWFDTADPVFNSYSILIDHSSFAGMAGVGSSALQLSNPACINNNVSGITIRDSIFAGNNTGLDTGIYWPCGGNSKNFTVEGGASRFTNLGWGARIVGASFGYFKFDGIYFGANKIEDINLSVGNLIVTNCGSEGSAKMLTIGGSTIASTAHITGSYWSGVTDGTDTVITMNLASADISDSGFANGRTGSSLPRVVFGGFPPVCRDTLCGTQALVSHNNFFQHADSTHGVYYDSAGGPLGVYRGTYNTLNANQIPIQILGDFGGVDGSHVPLPNYSPFQPRIFTPASSAAPCTPPEVAYDNNAAYFCTAPNKWVKADFSNTPAFIAREAGSNNAIAGTTAFPPGLSAGLTMQIKLSHTLQAGANTFNYNGGGPVPIKSHFNAANDIAAPYASGGIVTLQYNGTLWVDTSQ
jgi:hypothetical protein